MSAKQKEMGKAFQDVEKDGVGFYDPETKKRINIKGLVILTSQKEKPEIKKEVILWRDLAIIKNVYREKFDNHSAYCLKLFEKDSALFIERMIRAVEICTLQYVLNNGGALNIDKHPTITKGRNKFLWEA